MDAYDELLEVVVKFPIPIPKTDNLRRMLEIILTEEEAALAAKLPDQPMPEPLIKICEKHGYEPEKARVLLESMADKGVVFAREKEGKSLYARFPFVPGFIEFQFMKGEVDERSKALARHFNDYFYEGFGTSHANTKGEPIARVVPVQQEIPVGHQIQTYEKIKEMIINSNYKALTNCFCRHEHELLGDACDRPKDVCMPLGGSMSRFLVERGFAREVSEEEALMALERAEDAGLVHVTSNNQEKAMFVCNCCGCCCGFLTTITKLNQPGLIAHTNYIASCDEALCTDCGDCAERCQLKALTMDDETKKLAFDAKRCIGCGGCIRGCEFEALTLVRREEDQIIEPHKNVMEMGLAMIMARKEPGKAG